MDGVQSSFCAARRHQHQSVLFIQNPLNNFGLLRAKLFEAEMLFNNFLSGGYHRMFNYLIAAKIGLTIGRILLSLLNPSQKSE